MNSDQAHDAVTLSAMTVAGVYAYRKLVESKASSPTSHFVIGFGFVYVTLAVLADEAPAFGGMLAILIAVSDMIVNGVALMQDLSNSLSATKTATAATAAPGATVGATGAASAAAAGGAAIVAASMPLNIFGAAPPTVIPSIPAGVPTAAQANAATGA